MRLTTELMACEGIPVPHPDEEIPAIARTLQVPGSRLGSRDAEVPVRRRLVRKTAVDSDVLALWLGARVALRRVLSESVHTMSSHQHITVLVVAMPRVCKHVSWEGARCSRQTTAPAEFCIEHGGGKRNATFKQERGDAGHHPATEHDENFPEHDASWHRAGCWRWSSEDCSGDAQWYNPSGWHEVGKDSTPESVHFTVVHKGENLFTDGTVLHRMVAVPWSTLPEAP